MAQDDEDGPRGTRVRLERPVLDPLGLKELDAYIGELRAEIVRAEAEIARKQSHRSAADSVFRMPGQQKGAE